jgi:hypothetical protein
LYCIHFFKEKTMKHQWLIVALFIVFSLGVGLPPVGTQAKAPDLSGTWAVQYMGREGPIKMTFALKQTGEKLTGDYSGPMGPRKVTGAVKGNKVVFGWEMEGNGGITFIVAFKGAIESTTRMTGTVGNPFCGSEGCEWTATWKSKQTRNSAVPSPPPGQSPKPRSPTQ